MSTFPAYFIWEKREKKVPGLLTDHKYVFQHEKYGVIHTLINDLIYIPLSFSPVYNNSHSLLYLHQCTAIWCQIAFSCVH